MALVEVRPIEKPVWFRNEKARALIKPIKISCSVNIKTRQYSFPCPEDERLELEKITGLNLNISYRLNEEHPFFDDASSAVRLKYGSNFFDTEQPLDVIKLWILKGSDLVANSLEEYENRKFPKAKFVIINNEEEDELKAAKKSLRRKALVEIANLDTTKKLNIIKVLTGIDASKQSVNVIDLRLEQAIDKDIDGFFKVLNKKPDDLNTEALIISLINARILVKEGTIIRYGDLVIGADMPSAVTYLKSPKNQTLRIQLQEKLS